MELRSQKPSLRKQAKRKVAKAFLGISLALPLISGCEVFDEHTCAPEQSVCHQYNDTTVTLNRKDLDGRIASLDVLKEPDGMISDPLADAINETHAISSFPLPKNTKLTHTNKECFTNKINGVVDAEGYAVPASFEEICDGHWESGAYFVTPEFTLNNFFTINHEIGHLQHPFGGEVGAELNSFEQTALLSKLYLDQGSVEDAIEWILASGNHHFGLIFLKNAAGYFNSEKKTNESVYDSFSSEHILADIHILESLTANNQDIAGLRRLLDDPFLDMWRIPESKKSVDEFSRRYSGRKWGDVILDMRLRTKALLFRYFYSRFGEQDAMKFFEANTRMFFPVQNYYKGVVFGLEDLNCVSLSEPDQDSNGSCYFNIQSENQCNEWQATTYRWLTGIKLRCFSVSVENGDLSFQGWDINADAKYYHAGGATLNVDGLETDVIYDFYNRSSKVPLQDQY